MMALGRTRCGVDEEMSMLWWCSTSCYPVCEVEIWKIRNEEREDMEIGQWEDEDERCST
jgi:hypothetical protein